MVRKLVQLGIQEIQQTLERNRVSDRTAPELIFLVPLGLDVVYFNYGIDNVVTCHIEILLVLPTTPLKPCVPEDYMEPLMLHDSCGLVLVQRFQECRIPVENL